MSEPRAGEPRRIVSLVPSDTYTLAKLGVGERLVGRTEYCIAPAEVVASIPTVGGTKNADVAAIVALEPDLVVANREENRKIDIERLEQAGLRVLLSFPTTVREGLDHTASLATLFPSVDNRAVLAEAEVTWRRHAQRGAEPVAVFVPIWMDPLMTANEDTFISDLVELVGGRNVFADRARRYPLGADLGRRPPVPPGERDTRYPRVTLDEVIARAPRLILLPDEPHPFGEADAAVFRALPIRAHVRFCDGKDLMWYGLRALEGLDRLAAVLAMYY
jgi:ABC-type Fe3+-hydroxamate transport system substrate-binding protein